MTVNYDRHRTLEPNPGPRLTNVLQGRTVPPSQEFSYDGSHSEGSRYPFSILRRLDKRVEGLVGKVVQDDRFVSDSGRT